MKVLNNVLWVLVWVFMASACYEDKGNYDYRDLDEIIIDKLVWNCKNYPY